MRKHLAVLVPITRKKKASRFGLLRYFANNPPLRRPGVYRIWCTSNGWSYIGGTRNMLKRAYEHATNSGRVPGFDEQFQSPNSKSHFIFQPLYYTVARTGRRSDLGLHWVENSMINAYDSIRFGWNKPHPDISAFNKLPHVKAKRLATEASAATKAKRSAMMHRRYNDPDYRAKHLASTTAANMKPERNARMAATKTGGHWITDGKSDRYLFAGQPVPNGWHLGRCVRPPSSRGMKAKAWLRELVARYEL